MATVLTNKKGTHYADVRVRDDGTEALCVDMAGDIQIGAVELKDALTNDRANVVLRGDGKYALAVDMSSDIQIGAVEIKDWDTDKRVDVEECHNFNAMLVRDCEQFQRSTANFYGDATVAYDNTITLVSYTVPTGKLFKFNNIIMGGDADGEFYIEVNSTRIALLRNSASERTKFLTLGNYIELNPGDNVSVKVKNVSWVKRNTKQFEATLNGYTINTASLGINFRHGAQVVF